MPSVIDGIAMVTSVARITISSTTPPKYPANTPRSVPTTVTHTVPIKAEPTWAFIPGLNQRTVDKSTEKWLQEIYDNLDFSEWYAGHYHVESEENGIRIMFEDYDEICEKLN